MFQNQLVSLLASLFGRVVLIFGGLNVAPGRRPAAAPVYDRWCLAPPSLATRQRPKSCFPGKTAGLLDSVLGREDSNLWPFMRVRSAYGWRVPFWQFVEKLVPAVILRSCKRRGISYVLDSAKADPSLVLRMTSSERFSTNCKRRLMTVDSWFLFSEQAGAPRSRLHRDRLRRCWQSGAHR